MGVKRDGHIAFIAMRFRKEDNVSETYLRRRDQWRRLELCSC